MRHKNYNDYIEFQKTKTNDPVRRKKWLNEEWDLKLNEFNRQFSKLISSDLIKKGQNSLCLGARTGQEVKSLHDLGLESIGIDIVPCEPLVIKGDIHKLDFEDNKFDFIYTNILDHSLYPEKMASEVFRTLKNDGIFFLQIQFGINQDEYTEYEVKNTNNVIEIFKDLECIYANWIFNNRQITSHGMNFEFIFKKVV